MYLQSLLLFCIIFRLILFQIGSVCSNKMGKTRVYPMVMNGFSNTSGKEGKFSI
ncbi:hypothetical protein Hanom_Chr10g00925561 [Helianthus anomalus]